MVSQYSLDRRPKPAVWALIPARSGSKGVKDKNMQQLLGHSLLAWSIIAGRAVDEIDRVFVSTDSSEYMEEAREYGAETPFQRPAKLASDSATDLDVFRNFFEWAQRNSPHLPAAVVHLRPTTPMRDPDVLSAAVSLALERRGEVSAIRSVHESPESPYKWFRLDETGFLVTLDGQRSLDSANRARQYFPEVYVPNGYVDVLYPELVLESGQLHGRNVLPYKTAPVIEVDTIEDLELLRKVSDAPPRLVQKAMNIGR